MDAIKEKWAALSSRERMILVGGGIISAILLLYGALWSPLSEEVTRLQRDAEERKQDLLWMQGAAEEVKQLQRSSAGGNTRASGKSLLSVVDQTIRRSRLGSALKRVEPEGAKGVTVRFENASFDDLMLWLGRLEKNNPVSVARVTVDRLEVSGKVNARIVVEGQE